MIYNTGDETLDAQLHEEERRFYEKQDTLSRGSGSWLYICAAFIIFASLGALCTVILSHLF